MGHDLRDDLRWILVQMLFSLTIAEIARQAAKLQAQHRPWRDAVPAIVHLLLVTAVVTTSWVGWSLAVGYEPHAEHRIQGVFGLPFVVLIVDVALVIVYFIMATGPEVPPSRDIVTAPSVRNDSFWLMVVFLGYVVWGILVKWIMHGGDEFIEQGWPSILCLVLSLVMWGLLRNMNALETVLLADAGLIALVFLFRAMREKEPYWRTAIVLGIGLGVCVVLPTILHYRRFGLAGFRQVRQMPMA